MLVKFGGLDLQYRRLRREIDEAVSRVLASGYYVGGPELEAFERDYARACGAPHAVGVANGTDAIALALIAAGVQPGDEVVVPALSAYPTTVGVVQARAIPVFADVRLEDGLLDPEAARRAVTPRTRAILPVHLYGMTADLDAVSAIAAANALVVVEDCAQAHSATFAGRPAGSAGIAAAWSFYPTKNLGAVGDAGAVTTADAELAARLRRLRNYGQANRYEHVEPGVNSRLDPLQAAILAVKLRHLADETAARRRIADRYDAELAGLDAVVPLRAPRACVPSRHLYPVRVAEPAMRESLQRALTEAGVETLIHYPIPMPDQRATPDAWRARASYPVARTLCASLLSLPLHPDLADGQVELVISAVRAWAGRA